MNSKPAVLDQMTREIRACFAELRVLADALHSETGITSAMRAIIEFVADNGAATVPEIARTKHVSRQNIQVMVDRLAALKLVVLRANPGHKKSSLVTLTDKGRAAFREMRGREQVRLAAIADRFSQTTLDAGVGALTMLRQRLEAENTMNNRKEDDDE